MKKVVMIFLLAVGLGTLSVSAQKLTQADLDELFVLMSGSFSNQAQAKNDTSFFDIRLHSKPIWADKQGEHWLYIEVAMAGRPQAPYKQRVYSFSLVDDNTIACKVYSFKEDAMKYAGEWRKSEPLANVTLANLETRDGCTIYFHKTGRSIYDGSTKENNCANSMKNAAYATSVTHLDKVSMMTWDRGFDQSGKLVWGSAKGGYEFKKDNAAH